MPGIYQQLVVWQRAMEVTVDLYRITASFPNIERYGLTAQMRRASVSVASNIAEGQGRRTRNDILHFLGQARGSLLEVETQMTIALKLGFLDQATFARLGESVDEIGRMLWGLMRSKTANRP